MKKRQFVRFYDKYVPRIYRFVYLKVNSPQDSEDLTSEVFFKFWRNLSENNSKIDNPRALLYKIANNLVIDFYRKKSRTDLVLDPEDSVLTEIKDKTDLNEKLSRDFDIIRVKKAIHRLKGEYQNIIIWHYLDDFSAKEIAQILEKPEGTIRVKIHRCLKELKKRM
jgi:RNA polymerase sigma-70 factor, ECF subfamily